MMKLGGPLIFASYLVLIPFKMPNYQVFLVSQLCQRNIKKNKVYIENLKRPFTIDCQIFLLTLFS